MLAVALGAFHQWILTKSSREKLNIELLNLIDTGKIEYFEVGYTVEDLIFKGRLFPERFNFFVPELQQEILSRICSLHLPDLSSLNSSRLATLSYNVNIILESLNLNEITIHPSNISKEQWNILISQILKDANISIENLDSSKANFKSLHEIGKLLDRYTRLKVTFDLAHWLENGHSSNDCILKQFYNEYGSKISKIHFSVPTSNCAEYSNSLISDTHYLSTDSGWDISECFYSTFKKIPFVLEGAVPLNNTRKLEKEILNIKCLL